MHPASPAIYDSCWKYVQYDIFISHFKYTDLFNFIKVLSLVRTDMHVEMTFHTITVQEGFP